MSNAMAQMVHSYLLIASLGGGLITMAMAAMSRFVNRRKLLTGIALGCLFVFGWSTMVITAPELRLINAYFWLFTAAVVGGGIGTVTMRNVFHSALMLILSLFGVAGYFILVNAEFLAAVQVIIYIGGIMVLFLFGIMVSQNIIGTEIRQNTPHSPWAAVLCTILFLFMAFMGLVMSFRPTGAFGTYVLANNTQSIGWSLMATFTLPFEVASVLLLMAMLGAIILVRKD